MAKYSLRRLQMQDFDTKYQDLLLKLLPAINNSFENLDMLFNGNLTVSENLSAQSVDVPVTAPINSPIYFRSTLKGPCSHLLISRIDVNNGGTPLSAMPLITWDNSGSEIKITAITGLTSGTSYTFRLICLT
jgi:hypothetical protein